MTKLIHLSYCDEYEAEGFFTESGELLQAWSLNDANWRSEYMDPLLQALGFEVERIYDNDNPELTAKLKAWF